MPKTKLRKMLPTSSSFENFQKDGAKFLKQTAKAIQKGIVVINHINRSRDPRSLLVEYTVTFQEVMVAEKFDEPKPT